MFPRLTATYRIASHVLEHPTLVREVHRWVPFVYPVGGALMLANDYRHADSSKEKKNVVIRDLMVMGATVVGTMLATKRWMAFDPHEFEHVSKAFLQKLSHYPQEILKILQKAPQDISFKEWSQTVQALIRQNVEKLKAAPKGEQKIASWQQFAEDIGNAFPKNSHHLKDDHEHPKLPFFLTGLSAVLSGGAGGFVYNALFEKGNTNNGNIIKEGLFQLIANITLCVIGASIGAKLAKSLSKGLTGQYTKLKVPLKFLLVGGGLVSSISFGGYIANKIGQFVVNPVVHWAGGKNHSWKHLHESIEQAWQNPGETRRVELSDFLLHLDDIPEVFYFMGSKLVGPFIPPFFAVSGKRAGEGYRNSGHQHPHFDKPKKALAKPSTRPSHLHGTQSCFHAFYQQQQQALYATAQA